LLCFQQLTLPFCCSLPHTSFIVLLHLFLVSFKGGMATPGRVSVCTRVRLGEVVGLGLRVGLIMIRPT
jgi:hypothetical protein